MEEFFGKTLPKWFEIMEKRLKENSSHEYIVGEKMTIADFSLAALAYGSFLNEENPTKDMQYAIAEKYPVFLEYVKGLGEKLHDYIASRKPSPW